MRIKAIFDESIKYPRVIQCTSTGAREWCQPSLRLLSQEELYTSTDLPAAAPPGPIATL